MKRLLILLPLLCTLFANSQHKFTPVDRDDVHKQVGDQTKATYYAKLLKRFEAFDTSLTTADYRLLYYGFAFQQDYRGTSSNGSVEIHQLIKDKKYKEAIHFCDSILKRAPVSLTANYLKAMALNDMDASETKILQYRNRYRKLRDAVLHSGNGFTCETALKVIYREDEDDILFHYFEAVGNPPVDQQFPCDMFTINPTKYFNATKIYFNVEELGRKL